LTNKTLFFFAIIVLGSCSPQDSLYKKLSKEDAGRKQYEGHYKVGESYKVNNKIYHPKKNHKYHETGMCSWYGKKGGFHGRKTANGDTYNQNMLTAAHRTLPLPSMVKVTNLKNNKSLVVMINDRGPFRKDRIIDVSEEAARILGFKHEGEARVRVQYLPKESKELLSKLQVEEKHGSKAKKKIKDHKCSVNCHIKLVNMKHKFALN
jgi:rare lipoprotein A